MNRRFIREVCKVDPILHSIAMEVMERLSFVMSLEAGSDVFIYIPNQLIT